MKVKAKLARSAQTCAISGAVAAVIWLALVPQMGQSETADPRVRAFWLVQVGAAVLLGVLRRSQAVSIGIGMTVAQLVAAGYTAPRGDNDGLWLLWFPVILGFGVVLGLAARVGSASRKRWS